MTPEALLQAWREAFEVVQVFEHAELDEVGQARLAELRANEASLAEQVRAAGLIPEAPELRVGSWAPLPLFTSSPTVVVCEEGPAAVPAEPEPGPAPAPAAAVPEEVPVVRMLREFANQESRLPEARLRAAHLADSIERRGWVADLEPLGMAQRPLPPEVVAAPFLPAERDGFTGAQRVLVETLAISSPSSQQVNSVLSDAVSNSSFSREALASALDELLLPRPYPVVERDAARRDDAFVRLTPLALEMVDFPKGQRPQVHGGFIPNLLINGCAQPLSFPPLHLAEVIEAAKLMAIAPGADELMVMTKVALPNIDGAHLLRAPRDLLRSGQGLLEFVPRVNLDDVRGVLSMSRFPPGVTPTAVMGAIEAGQRAGKLKGVRSAQLGDDGVVRVEVDQPPSSRALLRLLDSEGFLRRSWLAAFRHAGGVNWLGYLLASFFGRTRMVVAYRLRARDAALKAQLDELEGLLAAVGILPLVHQVIDASLDPAEALWGLTHLGTPEFSAHVAFKGIDPAGARPFSETNAKTILKGGRGRTHRETLERRRGEVAEERRLLEESWRAPAKLDALVFAELDRIAAKYGGLARQSITAPPEMSWRLELALTRAL